MLGWLGGKLPVQNFLASNCSTLVSSYSCNRMYLQGGVKVQWNLDFAFLESSFSLILHNFISSARSSIRRILHIQCINICSLCEISWLYIPFEHELACCSCFKYFQLEIRKNLIFGSKFLCPVLSVCKLNCLWTVMITRWSLHHQRSVPELYWHQASVVKTYFCCKLVLLFEVTLKLTGNQIYLQNCLMVRSQSDCKFHTYCVNIVSWIYWELKKQAVLF